MASIACGLVAIGTCNGEVTSTILQTMMERSETDAKDTNARNLALGLGLTFLGKAIVLEGKFSQHLPHFCYSKLSCKTLVLTSTKWLRTPLTVCWLCFRSLFKVCLFSLGKKHLHPLPA